MIATKPSEAEEFFVVHPLFDEAEEKRSPDKLGRMEMSKPVRVSLMVLRGYLIVMSLLLAYHLLDLAGLFGHPLTK